MLAVPGCVGCAEQELEAVVRGEASGLHHGACTEEEPLGGALSRRVFQKEETAGTWRGRKVQKI